MNLNKLLNEDPSPGPGRSNNLILIQQREVQRTPSIAQTHSPASSSLIQRSPSHAFQSLQDDGTGRYLSATPARQSPGLSTQTRDQQHLPVVPMTQLQAPWPSKRAAPGEPDSTNPVKRARHRKYAERPIWARLSPRNAKMKDGTLTNGSSNFGAPITSKRAALNGAGEHSLNGRGSGDVHAVPSVVDLAEIHWSKPWLNSMPLDLDLLSARRVLGKWEKSMKYTTPYPDLLHRISDWIVNTLREHRAVVHNGAAFEIEAKIGTLINTNTGQRFTMPVENMALLSPSVHCRFESELELPDFVFLNEMLNKTLADSMAPGRESISYARKIERDSFTELSKDGMNYLPSTLRNVPTHGKDLRLRTTVDEKSSKVTARIVKVPLSNRHLYNPMGYDCRLSINVEVDYLNAGLNVEIDPTVDKPAPPDRRKERLSYTHLDKTYSVDLTTVHVSTLSPKYELEVEVNTDTLLKQMDLMINGSQHVFSEVVSGFWDNTQFLMRQRAG